MLYENIAHIQAYNNVFYGRVYYHRWYKDTKETSGLFLQKATHDLDYINYLLGGLKPVRICAMKSQQVFKGNEPIGKLCTECEKADTCQGYEGNCHPHRLSQGWNCQRKTLPCRKEIGYGAYFC